MTTTSAAHGIALFRELNDALNHHDLDRILAVYTPDVAYREPAVGCDVRGREALGNFFEPWLTATSITIDADDLFATEDRAACAWRYTGEIRQEMPGLWGPESVGRTFVLPGASLAVLRDGLIDEMTAYYDLAILLGQIGAQPEGPA